jgi:hypothetical protein
VVSHCTRAFAGRLEAIVLTGSFARGEGTVRSTGDGWEVGGDAEFLLVFQAQAPLPDLRQPRRDVESSLAGENVFVKIDLAAVHPSYLRNLQPHMFSYELHECGKVVWGDEGVLKQIPAFTAADIPLEDAWRTLMNRSIELLGAEPDQAPYRTVKLYLDMASSLLLFAGAYAPTYRERARRLRTLRDDLPFSIEEFAAAVEQCTEWKLGGGGEVPEGALTCARALWRWELVRLTGAAASASNCALMRAWMRKQPLAARLRGWLFVARRLGAAGTLKSVLRWLPRLWQASPRYWVYQAASALLMDGAREIWLPVRAPGRDPASDILWNYKQFLVETRA